MMDDKVATMHNLLVKAISNADVSLATFISRYFDVYNTGNIDEKIRVLGMIANGSKPGVDFPESELDAILDNYPPNHIRKEEQESDVKIVGEWD